MPQWSLHEWCQKYIWWIFSFLDGHTFMAWTHNLSHWLKTNIITVYDLHYCHRSLRWWRWCNKSGWRWDSLTSPWPFVTASPPCASCDRRRQRSSHRRRKQRLRPRSPTRWTKRTKQKKSVQRRCVTEEVGGTHSASWTWDWTSRCPVCRHDFRGQQPSAGDKN